MDSRLPAAAVCSVALFVGWAAGAPAEEVQPPRLIGVNYECLYHRYTTPDAVLRRDFERFRRDGLNVVSVHLYWQRLEGDVRGDYSGTGRFRGRTGPIYGDPFLAEVKRVIRLAHASGLQVLVTFHTLWNMSWCTPAYVKDPTCGECQTLAILRDPAMQDAFAATVAHAVDALKGTPGIWAWALLNEPWFWPKRLEPPYDRVDQRAMAVRLVERLAKIVKVKDGRPVTVRFVSMHTWRRPDGTTGHKNIFVDDWRWDARLIGALDFVSLNAYRPAESALHAEWRRILAENVRGIAQRFGKPVLITEFGSDSDDDAVQARNVEASIRFMQTLPVRGWLGWMWNSERETGGGCGKPGKGFNLCADDKGTPRRAYRVLTASATSRPSAAR